MTATVVRRARIALWGLCLLAASAASPAAISEADQRTFDRVMQEFKRETTEPAQARAQALGAQENLEALEYLVASKNFQLVPYFAGAFRRSPNPTAAANTALQKWLVGQFGDSIAESLTAVRVVDDPRLLELLYGDIAQLAKWRAERRKRCKAQGLGVERGYAYEPTQRGYTGGQPSLEFRQEALPDMDYRILRWRYVCAGSMMDDPRTDLDMKPRFLVPIDARAASQNGPTYLRPSLGAASLEAIVRTTIPGVETRLAPLLRDLSLMPAFKWKEPGSKGENISYPHPAAPIKIMAFLTERKHAPPTADLLEILAEYERELPSAWTYGAEQIGLLIELLTLRQTREGNEALARWIAHLAVRPDRAKRASVFSAWISRLGRASPAARPDLSQVKRQVFENVPYSELQEISELFAGVEKRWKERM